MPAARTQEIYHTLPCLALLLMPHTIDGGEGTRSWRRRGERKREREKERERESQTISNVMDN